MEISLSLIKRAEYIQFLKHLSLAELRKPFINDNKLWRKRISGFGPQTVPINILSSAYYEEIKSGNIVLQKKLITLIKSYFIEKKVFDYFHNFNGYENLIQWIDLGYKLSKANCEIPIVLVLKFFNIEVDEIQLNYIQYGFEIMKIEKNDYEQQLSTLLALNKQQEAKISDLSIKLNKANSKILTLEESLKENKVSEGRLKDENITLTNKILDGEGLFQRLDRDLKLTIKENDKLHLLCKKYLEEISNLKASLVEVQASILDMSKKQEECNKEKLHDYDATIKRITGEVIEELNIEIDISKQEFIKLYKKFGNNLNLANIWNDIFRTDNNLINYIEDVMRSNKVTISDLDILDEIENNIIFKYVIIKSLKALFFEYLSITEHKRNISSRFKATDD